MIGPNARVFVYGTLRRGECRDLRSAFGGGRFVGDGWVAGQLFDIGDYPGLRLDAGGSRVVGEIFEVSPETLGRLDELEGFDPDRAEASEYLRVRVSVVDADGTVEDCWTYEIAKWHCAGCRRIMSGDWQLDRVGR